MGLFEYRIRCPYCKTDTDLIAEEANPIIFECHGCTRQIVIESNIVYTVSKEKFEEISKKVKVFECGQVTRYKVRKRKQSISQEQIDDLHELLEKKIDVKDLIAKLK